ncbi:MAG: hypothetical protein JW791_02135 [Nanoarchaeota archaeon]|nr:hypothetical protein [Nanoarchaeota archaeon]
MMNPFKSYDVRGVFNKELLPEDVVVIASCYANLIKQKASIARDVRTSSEILKNSFLAGFSASGCSIVDIGVVPTPVSNFYGVKHQVENVTITGSHTSSDTNGLKFYDKRGVVYNDRLRRIEEKFLKKEFDRAEWDEIGLVETDDNAVREYVDNIKDKIKLSKSLKIVLDYGNGTTGFAATKLFEEMGCEVINISAEPDGHFPNRKPEPKEENLGFLQKRVVEAKADFGCAFDGDGDRCVFVDDKGKFVDGSRMACFFAREVLKEFKYAYIVASVDMSSVLKKVVEENQGNIVWCPVGLTSLSHGLIDNKGMFGAEVSCHFHFNDFYPFSDGILACAKLAKILSDSDKPFSAMVKELPDYPIKHAKFQAKDHEHKFEAFEKIKQELCKKNDANTVDGVKIFLNDTDWVLIRPSNTETVIRLTVEASNKTSLNKYFDEYSKLVRKFL